MGKQFIRVSSKSSGSLYSAVLPLANALLGLYIDVPPYKDLQLKALFGLKLINGHYIGAKPSMHGGTSM